MNSTLVYTASLDPPVGDPTAVYAPPLRYKREALAVHKTDPDRLKLSHLLTLVGRQYNSQWT